MNLLLLMNLGFAASAVVIIPDAFIVLTGELGVILAPDSTIVLDDDIGVLIEGDIGIV